MSAGMECHRLSFKNLRNNESDDTWALSRSKKTIRLPRRRILPRGTKLHALVIRGASIRTKNGALSASIETRRAGIDAASG